VTAAAPPYRDHPLRAYTAEEAAVILSCEPGWLEELARERKVRYTELSGTCHFTNTHLVAIESTFEVASADEPSHAAASPPELAHAADRAAALIGGTCKASWLKQQARDGIVPHVKLGGAYHFTGAHLAEIISIFEVRPKAQPTRQPAPAAPRPTVAAAGLGVKELPLLADRPPRRRGRQAPGHPDDAT
jgi:hypothetical protein